MHYDLSFSTIVGKYNQFDTMVYPELKSRMYLKSITDWLSSSSTSIPDSESMRQKCLVTYLDGVRDDLIHCFATHTCTCSVVDQVVNNAIQIVTSLATQRIAQLHSGKPAVWGEYRLVSHVSVALSYMYMHEYILLHYIHMLTLHWF